MVTTPPRVTSRLAWGTVGLLWVAYLANYVDRQVVFSIFPVLRSDLHFSDVQLGLVGSIFIWVYSLCMPVAGRLADLIRRDRIVVASLILWSLATLGTCLSTSARSFLVWRALIGVTESLYVPAALGLIAVLHAGPTRSRALSVHATAQIVGIMIGGWYGGWIADTIGWRQGFFALAVAGIGYTFILPGAFRRLPGLAAEQKHGPSSPLEVFGSRCYLALMVAFFAFCTILWMIYGWFPNFIYERYGLSMAGSGFTATAYLQTSCAVGVLAGGAAADWMVKRVPAARFYVASLGSFLSAPCAYLALAVHSLALLKLASVGFGFFAGAMMANVFASAYDVVSRQNYGVATGVLNLAGGLAGGMGMFFTGFWKASVGMVPLMRWAAMGTALATVLLTAVVATNFEKDRRRAFRGQTAGPLALHTTRELL